MRVFREGAENSARGGRAPVLTSGFGEIRGVFEKAGCTAPRYPAERPFTFHLSAQGSSALPDRVLAAIGECLLPRLLPDFVPFKGGVNQFSVEPGVRLAKPFHRLRQFNKSPRRRLFQQTNRANHREAAMNGCIASGAVVHQYGVGFDFLRQTDRFQLASVHAQREIKRLGRLNSNPRRQRARPLAHQRRRVRLLKFAEDGGRNHHLAE